MKKIIGIVPATDFNPQKSTMCDWYKVGNNYAKRVTEAGCVPISIAPVDKWCAEEALDLCDGFIVQGGDDFYPYHFQVVHHAYTHGKRYLGICLGEQVIYYYFYLRNLLGIKEGEEGGEDILDRIWDLYYRIDNQEGENVPPKPLKRIENHYGKPMVRGQEDDRKHDVNIVPGSLLHRVIGSDTLRGASFHYLQVPENQDLVKINAWAAHDSTVVEGVEHGENLLGIQCHPEVDGLLPEIFKFLAE